MALCHGSRPVVTIRGMLKALKCARQFLHGNANSDVPHSTLTTLSAVTCLTHRAILFSSGMTMR